MTKQNNQAGERTQEVGTRQYIVIRRTDSRELTQPMSWAAASRWADSPMTKGAYPEGVVIISVSALVLGIIAQRDELLGALKSVVHDLEYGTAGRWKGEGSASLCAAIAQAEGRAS